MRFHKVSVDYLPLSEFTHRYNRRQDNDPFAELISEG